MFRALSEQLPYLELLKDRINLESVPFSERNSCIMVFCSGSTLSARLAERRFKLTRRLLAYRDGPVLIDQWKSTDGGGNLLDLDTLPART